MSTEEWRGVVGWEERYEVSSHGRLRSLCHRGQPREFYAMIAGAHDARGYHYAALCRDKKVSRRGMHRLVLEAFVGPCPVGYEGCHLDGNPSNNRLDNLKWGTKKENMSHRDSHGTTSRGEHRPLSVFTEEEVRDMRQKYASGVKRSAIVKTIVEQKGCDPTVVRDILGFRTWKHVQ